MEQLKDAMRTETERLNQFFGDLVRQGYFFHRYSSLQDRQARRGDEPIGSLWHAEVVRVAPTLSASGEISGWVFWLWSIGFDFDGPENNRVWNVIRMRQDDYEWLLERDDGVVITLEPFMDVDPKSAGYKKAWERFKADLDPVEGKRILDYWREQSTLEAAQWQT